MSIEVRLAGQNLWLLAERAVYWPAQSMLLVADLHFGKELVFRRAGIAVPDGHVARDLLRLESLLRRYPCRDLVILGDLVHGALAARLETEVWIPQWQNFRDRHHEVRISLVEGNHDRALNVPGRTTAQITGAARILDLLRIDAAPTAWLLAGLRLCHDLDEAMPDSRHVNASISGHSHPVASIPGLPGRFPAFVLGEKHLILPSFGGFTGGHKVKPADGQKVYPCVAEKVLVLPQAR